MPRYAESKRQQIKHQTRTRLLAAAIDAFSQAGYERANVDAISRSAGFAKGTIYNYFPSKRAILLTLIETIAGEHNEYVREAVVGVADPARRLEAFYQAGFAWVSTNPQRARLVFNTLNGADDDLRQMLFAAYLPMFRLVGQEILTAGVASGQFRPLASEEIRGLIMLFYLGAASQWDAEGRPWASPADVADLVLQGLLRR